MSSDDVICVSTPVKNETSENCAQRRLGVRTRTDLAKARNMPPVCRAGRRRATGGRPSGGGGFQGRAVNGSRLGSRPARRESSDQSVSLQSNGPKRRHSGVCLQRDVLKPPALQRNPRWAVPILRAYNTSRPMRRIPCVLFVVVAASLARFALSDHEPHWATASLLLFLMLAFTAVLATGARYATGYWATFCLGGVARLRRLLCISSTRCGSARTKA